jgi:hypothetical protein
MPREPQPELTVEETIELDAKILQRHDSDEIRARYWHTNMRIRRVFFSILWLIAVVLAYTTVPIIALKLLQ